jgi:predicted DNA-binding transcriptional regulator YafY
LRNTSIRNTSDTLKMLETSARLLKLLSLLQSRREWTGHELSDRLGVTTRTVRKDVDRLRTLGYPVGASPGVAGGYRLGPGAALPPLLLDDDEAVAVAVGLRTAAGGSVTGIEETSLRALTKLEQVLPALLRRRVNALQSFTVPVAGADAPVDPQNLVVLAAACRDGERLRFDYLDHDATASRRTVEPHRLVHARSRWYLVGWDADRAAWRTFRVDRIEAPVASGGRFPPREPPADDLAAYVREGLRTAPWRYRARVTVHASAEAVAARVPPLADHVEPVDDRSCVLHGGSDTPQMLAVYLGMLDLDFEVNDAPELAEHLRRLADRYLRAAG